MMEKRLKESHQLRVLIRFGDSSRIRVLIMDLENSSTPLTPWSRN
jgi:hypothetical protein